MPDTILFADTCIYSFLLLLNFIHSGIHNLTPPFLLTLANTL